MTSKVCIHCREIIVTGNINFTVMAWENFGSILIYPYTILQD